jgi:hypothetical protein
LQNYSQLARRWRDDRNDLTAQDCRWPPHELVRPVRPATTLAQRRAEALRTLFPKLSSWRETAMERSRRQEIEAYLFQASDGVDLERRLRWLHGNGKCRSRALRWQGDA